MGPIGNLRDLIAALWRKAWLIVLVLAVGLPLVARYAMSQVKTYEATAVIQIRSPDISVTATGQLLGQSADAQINLITQNLMTRDKIEGHLETFGLFAGLSTMTERVAALRGAIITTKLIDPAAAWRPDAQPSGLALQVRLDDPVQAANLANALVEEIISESRARTEGRTSRTLEFLVREEARVGSAIAAIENEIAQYRATHLQSLPEGLTNQRDRLSRLSESRLALEQQAIDLQSTRERLRADDSALQQARLADQIALVEQEIAEIEAAVAAAPDVERELSALQRQLVQLEAEFTVLTTQRTEAATAQLLATQDDAERFAVLERATVPEFPISGGSRKIAMAGGMAVVMAAFGLALGLEIMNPAIRTAAQLERALGVQPAVTIPRLRNRRGKAMGRLGWILAGLALLAAIGSIAVLITIG